jgi:lipid-A-disaccharide synthase
MAGDRPHRVLIVAGEASGDHLAAKVVAASRALVPGAPGISYFGVGGDELAAAGAEVIIPFRELAVTGLTEVVRHYPAIRRAFAALSGILRGPARPDLLLTVDYPDFNLRLAAVAKKAGVPVLHYVSPTVWAWRPGRVRTVARSVDRLAAILPFEPRWYDGTGLAVEYVGNPHAEEAEIREAPAALRARVGIPAVTPVVGIFPGSRRNEIVLCLPALLGAAKIIRGELPGVRFLLPLAPGLDPSLVEESLAGTVLPVTMLRGDRFFDVAAACDAALCVSGTAALQTALAGTPLAIVYRLAPLTHLVLRLMLRVDRVGLPNLVAGETVAAEYLQDDATPENLAGEILRLLRDGAYRAAIKEKLVRMKERLGGPGCSRRVAEMVVEMMGTPPAPLATPSWRGKAIAREARPNGR